MTGRRLLIALIAAALYAGVLAASASADQHRARVTLVTGQVLVVTVNVPPGGSIAASLPPLGAPVQSVVDLGPVATPTPPPAPQVPTPTVPQVPGVTPPSPNGGGGGSSGGGGGSNGGGSHSGGNPQAPSGGQTTNPAAGSPNASSPNTQSLTGHVNNAKKKIKKARKKVAKHVDPNAMQAPDGTPTMANPTLSLATPGAAAVGVPNFFIDKFRIPPFLLPIYQAAGIQYGIRWEVLAAINEIETDYGRNLNVSSAGAVGWMQFMPSTWDLYGVDANGDKIRDPYNPADAIFAAARYLRAAGGDTNLRQAIFAYNHADWYVQSVLLRARLIGGLPADLVGSLTGLTEGHFPVLADATYASSVSKKQLRKQVKRGANAANIITGNADRQCIDVFAHRGAPVVAVNDGVI